MLSIAFLETVHAHEVAAPALLRRTGLVAGETAVPGLLREQGFEVLLVDVGPGAENDHVRGVAHLGFVERVAADSGFGDPRLAFIAAGDDVVPGLGIDRRRAKAQQRLDLLDDFGRQLAVGVEGFGSATRGGDFGDVHRKKSGRKKG